VSEREPRCQADIGIGEGANVQCLRNAQTNGLCAQHENKRRRGGAVRRVTHVLDAAHPDTQRGDK
jgi:hypothetical protein